MNLFPSMKTSGEIKRRLEKLRLRYLRQYSSATQSKKPENCVHNVEHSPRLPDSKLPTEFEISPRIVSTLVVIQPEIVSIRLCTYGSDNPETWNGTVCDSEEVSKSCPFFQPVKSEDQANEEFEKLLADDAYVLKHYKDIAVLQWVLNYRVFKSPLSIWGKFLIWAGKIFRKRLKLPQLVENKDVPKGLWKDADTENSGE